MSDYIKKKSAQLGLERAGQLAKIQQYLDGLYPGQCRALSINEGVLRITTPNASVASELRMRQAEILRALSPHGVKKLIFTIR